VPSSMVACLRGADGTTRQVVWPTRSVTVDKAELKDSYACPVYKTKMRPKGALGHPDGGYIFTAGLKTKDPPSKWTMATPCSPTSAANDSLSRVINHLSVIQAFFLSFLFASMSSVFHSSTLNFLSAHPPHAQRRPQRAAPAFACAPRGRAACVRPTVLRIRCGEVQAPAVGSRVPSSSCMREGTRRHSRDA
jgi:hypothetical protein